MSLKPLSFREIEEQTGDIYEAVVVMERRAKQILRDRLVEKIIKEEESREMGVFDEVPDEIDPETYQEVEKVTTVAIEEFITGGLTWHKHPQDSEK
jgi:DNA-directed RNA polymerase subunit K/omega